MGDDFKLPPLVQVVRITQNGKSRHYVQFIENYFLTNKINGRLQLFAEGRAINKLVTVVEIVKQLLCGGSDINPFTLRQVNEIGTSSTTEGTTSTLSTTLFSTH